MANLALSEWIDDASENVSVDVKRLKKAFEALRRTKKKVEEWSSAWGEAELLMTGEGSRLEREAGLRYFEIAKAILGHVDAGALHVRQLNKGKELALSLTCQALDAGIGGPEAEKMVERLTAEMAVLQFGADALDETKKELIEAFEAEFGEAFAGGDFDTMAELQAAMRKQATDRHERDKHGRAREKERMEDAASERAYAAATKPKSKAQEVQIASVKEIYRKLASALHPDRAAGAEDIEARLGKMKKANELRDADDFPGLLEMAAEEGVLDAGHFGTKAPEALKAYVKMVKGQQQKEEQKLQEFSFMTARNYRAFVSHPSAIVALAKREIEARKTWVSSLDADLASVAQPKGAREFVKTFKRAS